MEKSVSVGIHVPSVSASGLADGQAYAGFFRDIETMGLDAIWVEDRIFHAAHLADSLMLLSWAAANTQRVRLGTAVLLLNLRQAPILARQVSTLHHLSGGRVALGVSIGGRPEEYQALGVPMDRRVAVFRDGMTALRALLAGEPVTHPGPYFPLDGAIVRPAAKLPILVGGIAEAAIRRAGELGDGWIMGPFGSAKDFEHGWRIAQAGARAAGKDPDDLTAGRLLYVAVDNDRAKARAEMAQFLHGYYGPDFDVDQHAVFGPAAEVRVRLREQVDAGITHLMLGVPSLDRAQLRRLAEDVAPALR
ncbi:MAG: LLM class flavin-dependent oxidoreductase [Proteobacteria bacterium]|nr:LLM class flavin-dependent oxidoreductase [Pseudomonadota bacterium]